MTVEKERHPMSLINSAGSHMLELLVQDASEVFFFEAGPGEGEDLCRVRFEMITFLVSGQFIVFFPIFFLPSVLFAVSFLRTLYTDYYLCDLFE